MRHWFRLSRSWSLILCRQTCCVLLNRCRINCVLTLKITGTERSGTKKVIKNDRKCRRRHNYIDERSDALPLVVVPELWFVPPDDGVVAPPPPFPPPPPLPAPAAVAAVGPVPVMKRWNISAF